MPSVLNDFVSYLTNHGGANGTFFYVLYSKTCMKEVQVINDEEQSDTVVMCIVHKKLASEFYVR